MAVRGALEPCFRMLRVVSLLAPLALFFAGCQLLSLGGSNEEIEFTGNHVGCGNYVIAINSRDQRWILAIYDQTAFTGDTLYEQEIADTGSASVSINRFDKKYPAGILYCNDVFPDYKLLETRSATQGRIRVKVYNVSLDTVNAERGFVMRDFTMDIELRDVLFEGGTRIDSLKVDSVHAGWMAG